MQKFACFCYALSFYVYAETVRTGKRNAFRNRTDFLAKLQALCLTLLVVRGSRFFYLVPLPSSHLLPPSINNVFRCNFYYVFKSNFRKSIWRYFLKQSLAFFSSLLYENIKSVQILVQGSLTMYVKERKKLCESGKDFFISS